MSLFAKNYSLSASATYKGEEPKSPEIGNVHKPGLVKQSSTSSISSRNLEVPSSPRTFSKKLSLFSKSKRSDHGSLGIELDSMPSPGMLSPCTVPGLAYNSTGASVGLGGLLTPDIKDGHYGSMENRSPLAIDETKIEYFSIPPRKASKHITIAIDQTAVIRARKAMQTQKRIEAGYGTCEACMEGARGHEKKSGTYPQGSEKAKHHLHRASDLFAGALAFKPDNAEALVGKCRVIVALADCYQPARTAVPDLQDALADLQDAQDSGVLKRRPKTMALQAKALMLLSSHLHEMEHTGVVPDIAKTWKSPVGQTARQAMKLWEEVATALVNEAENAASDSVKSATAKATDALMNLASSAMQVGNLAPTQVLSDEYYAIVELALDRASTLVLNAKPPSNMEASINNPFLTQIHLLSCEANIGRIEHLFALNGSIDEDDFKAVISDLEVLTDRERSRAKSMRGSKAAAASTAAFNSLKQLADTRYHYACLLRQIWRKRKALPANLRRASTSSIGSSGSSEESSQRTSVEVPSKVNHSMLFSQPRKPSKAGSNRTLSFADDTILEMDETSEDPARESTNAERDTMNLNPPISGRKHSLNPASTGEPMSPRRPDHSMLKRPSFVSPFDPKASLTAVGLTDLASSFEQRRGSWMPSGDIQALRARRLSSIGLAKQDSSISAWNRKASVVSISSDDGNHNTSSSALVLAAWNALSEAIKEYKVSLTILSSSHVSASELAQSKSEVLLAIADASLFKASLSPRLAIAAEKRTPLLVSAEVYATWAAREVGWASVIEGNKVSEAADKRTSSWRADEAGRIAVLTLLRTWWFRAASSPPKEVDIKIAAKEAADKVTRRLAQREGVSNSLVAKYRYKLLKADGSLDTAENLFWSSVSSSLV